MPKETPRRGGRRARRKRAALFPPRPIQRCGDCGNPVGTLWEPHRGAVRAPFSSSESTLTGTVMADALLDFLRSALPDELAASLRGQLDQLERGDFHAIFQHELVQVLLGHREDEATKEVSFADYPVWSDYIFRRLGLLLGKRQESSGSQRRDGPVYRQHLFLLVAHASTQAFLQSNVTGPPLPFSSAKTVLPLSVASDAGSVRALRRKLILSLSVDGEATYRLTPNVELLCLADTILTCPPIMKYVEAAQWARLRADFLHQRLLSEIAPTLQSSIYESLGQLEKQLIPSSQETETSNTAVPFLLERAAIHIHHGMDAQAQADLGRATSMRKFEFALTGLLGKRTKYQEKAISQLVVLARSSDMPAAGDQDGANGNESFHSAPSTAQPDIDGLRASLQPKNLDLNDDTLLESTSFSGNPVSLADVKDESGLPASLTSLDPAKQPMLHPLDSIILLSLASSITNTSPAHGLTREETLPYATRVLEGGSSNWQVYTQALLVRSRIEGYKSRTAERGLLQLQALVDQVIAETASDDSAMRTTTDGSAATTFLPKPKASEAAPASERLQYIYPLCSPSRWDLEAELAARWVSLGGLRSALEIYERLEMWAEAALCWAATEKEDKARKIVRKQLFHATSGRGEQADDEEEKWEGAPRDPPPVDAPRLYCILGDIDRDPAMYEKAWEVSNQRYARAQRSLGRHYFALKDYAKAANAYSKSLKVNQLNHSSWFALGCALLELAEFERAAEAFSRTVQLDETDAEAWSNLAAALLHRDPQDAHVQNNQTEQIADGVDDEEPVAPQRPPRDPQQHRHDALEALKRAARLKYDNYRIWDNLLTVSASLTPPSYADIVNAQKRIIEIRGSSVGEKCIDEDILDLLVRHIITSDAESTGYDPSKPGLARMVVELVDKHVVPLITASRRLWQIVARLALWRWKPGSALEAHEKAWRAVVSQPGWEYGTEKQWDEVVDATVELVDAYQNLGEMEKTEGLGAASGVVVAKDWKFKARSAIRGTMGRGKGSWEGTAGWERLGECMEGLKT